jgi:hypothetical protein
VLQDEVFTRTVPLVVQQHRAYAGSAASLLIVRIYAPNDEMPIRLVSLDTQNTLSELIDGNIHSDPRD